MKTRKAQESDLIVGQTYWINYPSSCPDANYVGEAKLLKIDIPGFNDHFVCEFECYNEKREFGCFPLENIYVIEEESKDLRNAYFCFLDDRHIENRAARLSIKIDKAGDIDFWISNAKNNNPSDVVTLLGQNGESRYNGLAQKIINAITEWEKEQS